MMKQIHSRIHLIGITALIFTFSELSKAYEQQKNQDVFKSWITNLMEQSIQLMGAENKKVENSIIEEVENYPSNHAFNVMWETDTLCKATDTLLHFLTHNETGMVLDLSERLDTYSTLFISVQKEERSPEYSLLFQFPVLNTPYYRSKWSDDHRSVLHAETRLWVRLMESWQLYYYWFKVAGTHCFGKMYLPDCSSDLLYPAPKDTVNFRCVLSCFETTIRDSFWVNDQYYPSKDGFASLTHTYPKPGVYPVRLKVVRHFRSKKIAPEKVERTIYVRVRP